MEKQKLLVREGQKQWARISTPALLMHRLGTAWGMVALARIRWLIQRGCSQGCRSTLFSKNAEPAIEEHLSDNYKSPHRNVHDTG